jgi:hypothetical protein
VPAGFFACFANGGFNQAFAVFEMACWLIEHEAAVTFFLDEEKAAVFLDDAGYGDAGAFGGWCERHG